MFSKKVYKRQNGKIYHILSIITFICFLYGVSIVIRSIFNIPLLIEFGDFSIMIGIICVFGIIGFPFVLSLNKGMKNLYLKSKVKIENNKIYYTKQAEFHWTAVGHVDEKHYFVVNTIKSYQILSRWIIINGDIDVEIINNDRSLEKKKVNMVKIPRAFEYDNEIIKLITSQKI